MSIAVPSPGPCACGCAEPAGAIIHRVLACLRVDDVDGAIESGLLDRAPCPSCSPECTTLLRSMRDERLAALAARERFRRRAERLERRDAERAARRSAVAHPAVSDASPAHGPAPALPPAAAAALARAKARAAERSKP